MLIVTKQWNYQKANPHQLVTRTDTIHASLKEIYCKDSHTLTPDSNALNPHAQSSGMPVCNCNADDMARRLEAEQREYNDAHLNVNKARATFTSNYPVKDKVPQNSAFWGKRDCIRIYRKFG